MKPFELERALAGDPVVLINDLKAFITTNLKSVVEGKICKNYYPLRGYVILEDEIVPLQWTTAGAVGGGESASYSIRGMWEEKELTQEEILEKAYKENLRITFPRALLTNGYEVIAKTKHNSYIIRNGSYIVDSCNLDDVTFSIYEENKPENLDIDNTITVTLPKPFKPKEGDLYYCIDLRQINGILETNYMSNYLADRSNLDNGQCFKSESDAKAWLDAMKNALDN